ncbi:MAG: glycosyltransferase [Emcibacteraceae bacterium]|nr:glycosyltransferase [Emcibacteraceae bacterium]
MRKTKIVFLTPGIQTGGAERQLAYLAKGLMALNFDVLVISLTSVERQNHLLDFNEINVVQLDFKKNINLLFSMHKLRKIIKNFSPDIVQGWMYSGNIVATICSFGMGVDLYHSLRASNMDLRRYGFKIWLNGKLAAFAKAVIVNSSSGIQFHQRVGFSNRKMCVVFNGINTKQFKPNKKSRHAIRERLSIRDTETVVVYAARVDPMKGHEKVIKIAMLCPNIKFILVGQGTERLGSLDNVIKLGLIQDMNSIYCASDGLLSLSNFGEGFPNVIGEAMACGVPVLANDVGDSWHVMGGLGCLLEGGSLEQVANEIKLFFKTKAGRPSQHEIINRIRNDFSDTGMVESFRRIYLRQHDES